MAWFQVGEGINGDSLAKYFGGALDINYDGTVVIGGTVHATVIDLNHHIYDLVSYTPGMYRIYDFSSGSWNLRSNQTYYGDSHGDELGYSVSISSDGNTVASGAPATDLVEITSFDGNGTANIDPTWQGSSHYSQLGFNYWYSDFGGKVRLSGDGNTIAIAGINYDTSPDEMYEGYGGSGYENDGVVAILRRTDAESTYELIGSDIHGEVNELYFGTGVALSSDGNTVAIGSHHSATGWGNSKLYHVGTTRVYRYINNSWTQLGSSFYGEEAQEESGRAISLSSDGNILAIGSPTSGYSEGSTHGKIRIFEYTNNSWNQIGNIVGEDRDLLGYRIDLSDDGKTLASYIDGGINVYSYSNNEWVLAEEIDINSVSQVVISGDGSTIASSYTNWSDGTTSNLGQISVFKIDNVSPDLSLIHI